MWGGCELRDMGRMWGGCELRGCGEDVGRV